MDRRVGRTKRRLKTALLELVRERGLAAVTIRELTERADVGRSTFYSHFGSKEDLLFDQFDGWILSLAEAPAPAEADAAGAAFRFSLPLLRHIGSDRRLFRAVMGSRSGGRVRRRATELVTEVVRRELARRPAPTPVAGADAEEALQARAHAVAGAFVGLASWWMDGSRALPAEAVDAVFQEAVR